MDSEFGFIILRHVSDQITNTYWRRCLNCIRTHYPKTAIMIIDDNSDQKFVTECLDNNCHLIQYEFPGRCELLPFYYMWKLKPFDRAIFVHDSVLVLIPFNFVVFSTTRS